MNAPRLLSLLLLATPLAAQGPPRPAPEDLLPASTWFHARLAGLGGGRLALEQSGLFQLVTRDESKSLTELGLRHIDPYLTQAVEHVRAHLERAGIAPEVLRSLLHGPIALGLGRMTLFGTSIVPSPLLVIDVAGRESQARDALTAGLRAGAKLTPDGTFAVRSDTFQGVEIVRHGPESMDHCVAYAWLDGFLLIGLNDFYLKDAIAARAAKGGATLAGNSSIARNRARLPGQPAVAMSLDVSFFLGWVERYLPYEASALGRALGVEGFTGLHVATGPAGRGDMTVVQLDIPGSETGLLKALASRPVSFKAASWLPAETAVFVTLALDGRALAAAAQAAMTSLPAAWRAQIERQFHRHLTRGLGAELQRVGLDPQALHDCLSCLGSELTLAANVPPSGGLVPEAVLFLDLADAAKAEAMVVELVDKFLPQARKTMSFKEHTIHWLDLPETMVRVSPCFVVKDGMLIASLHPQVLKKAVGRSAQQEGSLAADPRFAALVKETGRSNVFVDLRLPTAARWVHGIGQPFVHALLDQHPELGIDPAALPTPEILEQSLEDLVLAFNVDQHGLTLSTRSPAGIGSVLATAMAAGDWILAKLGKGKVY